MGWILICFENDCKSKGFRVMRTILSVLTSKIRIVKVTAGIKLSHTLIRLAIINMKLVFACELYFSFSSSSCLSHYLLLPLCRSVTHTCIYIFDNPDNVMRESGVASVLSGCQCQPAVRNSAAPNDELFPVTNCSDLTSSPNSRLEPNLEGIRARQIFPVERCNSFIRS